GGGGGRGVAGSQRAEGRGGGGGGRVPPRDTLTRIPCGMSYGATRISFSASTIRRSHGPGKTPCPLPPPGAAWPIGPRRGASAADSREGERFQMRVA